MIADGGHNPEGVDSAIDSVKQYFTDPVGVVTGVMADKDYEEMIEALLPLAIDFITVTPESNRALQSKDLAECIQRKGVKARYAEDLESVIRPLLPQKNRVDGITAISKNSGETHIYLPYTEQKIVAFGSLYFIGTIEAMLEANSR